MHKRAASTSAIPADQGQRDLILAELDANILVEASAGTGKTTSMVGRMLALLRSGKCANIRTMAAVTFTRKAAAELRGRFQSELEKGLRESEGRELENLERALGHIEQCFIGTIHSFCARLLRERPVEAGIDLSFEEIDDQADLRLREEAWGTYTAGLIADDPDGLLRELHRLGLQLSDLKDSFMRLADFPDVDQWPMPEAITEPAGWARITGELEDYVSHMARLAPGLPDEHGRDTLITEYKRLPRIVSHYGDLHQPDQLMEVLELLDKNVVVVQKAWKAGDGFSGEDAKREKERWEQFREEVAGPGLRAWRELRYSVVMRLLLRAQGVYDDLRRARGQLNFQDLLTKTARLLRENPAVRRYFQSRFTHLLVDEFQDTDPIQAEVIFLLVSSDPGETDWRNCPPRPGSLFIVGDPKQSIYRFRRADIVTYNEVKEIIRRRDGAGGEGLVLSLSTNFRAMQPLISWVNLVFEPDGPDEAEKDPAMLRFPAEDSEKSPSYVPLIEGREEGSPGELAGLYVLEVPEDCDNKERALAYEADLIARTIRSALDLRVTVPRTRQQLEEGRPREVDPSDFMIVTRNTTNLQTYARKLQEYEIPHQVTGGGSLNEVSEIGLLNICLKAAAQPDDPISLLAALRSELFGLSDTALYAYAKKGGRFSYHADPPPDLSPRESEAFHDAFNRLATYSSWLSSMPLLAALERMVTDLGLPALSATRPGGDVEAGSLYKALELLRGAQSEMWTTAQLLEYLGRLAEGEERHDGVSARSWEQPAVRILNLHKVKGLEAPIVFLADPSGESEHHVDLHIDRSGDQVVGYMAIYGKRSGYGRGKPLAHPAGWEYRAEREREFLRAENLRLRYVAATRAAAATIITQKEKRNHLNPWHYFADYLHEEAKLQDPGPQAAPARSRQALSAEEFEEGTEAVSLRLQAVEEPTYDSRGAKEYALSLSAEKGEVHEHPPVVPDPVTGTRLPEGEHGTEWGEVIHLLLQAAMERPHADLEKLALTYLAQKDMDVKLAPHAAQTAHSVTGSEIWRRAQRSTIRLAEAPFQVLLEDSMPLPTILRGAIDLVFKEEGGWVLVDYKTDDLTRIDPHSAAERYGPQVRLYARVWEGITGEPVKETLIYFVPSEMIIEVTYRPL